MAKTKPEPSAKAKAPAALGGDVKGQDQAAQAEADAKAAQAEADAKAAQAEADAKAAQAEADAKAAQAEADAKAAQADADAKAAQAKDDALAGLLAASDGLAAAQGALGIRWYRVLSPLDRGLQGRHDIDGRVQLSEAEATPLLGHTVAPWRDDENSSDEAGE